MRPKDLYLIGNGSLGTFAGVLIGRLANRFGWRIKLIDFDKVERHNLENQLFRKSDIGRPKTEALAGLISEFSTAEPEPVIATAGEETEFNGIVVVLVDNMAARRAIWEACRYNINVPLLVDGRSGGEDASVFALDPRDPDCVHRYEGHLYTDGEALPAPCANARQVPMLFLIAGTVGEILARYEEQSPKEGEFIHMILSASDGDLPEVRGWLYTDMSY